MPNRVRAPRGARIRISRNGRETLKHSAEHLAKSIEDAADCRVRPKPEEQVTVPRFARGRGCGSAEPRPAPGTTPARTRRAGAGTRRTLRPVLPRRTPDQASGISG